MNNKRISEWQRLHFGMFVHFGLYSMLGGVWNGKKITDGYSEQTRNLSQVFGRGGNYLLNIGPRGDGSVVGFEAKVLHGVGKWIGLNGGLDACAEFFANQHSPSPDLNSGGEQAYWLAGGDYSSYKPFPVEQTQNPNVSP